MKNIRASCGNGRPLLICRFGECGPVRTFFFSLSCFFPLFFLSSFFILFLFYFIFILFFFFPLPRFVSTKAVIVAFNQQFLLLYSWSSFSFPFCSIFLLFFFGLAWRKQRLDTCFINNFYTVKVYFLIFLPLSFRSIFSKQRFNWKYFTWKKGEIVAKRPVHSHLQNRRSPPQPFNSIKIPPPLITQYVPLIHGHG